jgi:hypothetical protein
VLGYTVGRALGPFMDKLAHGGYIADCKLYFAIGLLSQLFIRAIMSALSAWYLHRTRQRPQPWLPRSPSKPDPFKLFLCCAWGTHPKDSVYRDDSDYLLPFFLGLIEQYSYPVIMAIGEWKLIGAWLAFKTIAHWHRWSSDRFTFNRYLIGNALVVVTSLLMVRFVEV